jgi:prepilin-type N-terminal cleavage/methylation domain-containing protein
MIQRLKTKQKGFTIIEVMIVLAIAGLILLIVFLAVPALQRAQRNTGRKEDAGRLVTAFQDFISNSSGNLPGQVNGASNGAFNSTQAKTDCSSIKSDAGTLNQYTNLSCGTALGPNQMIISDASSSGTVSSSAPTGNEVEFVENAKCSGTSSYSYSNIQQQAVLFYSLETGGGYAWACENA